MSNRIFYKSANNSPVRPKKKPKLTAENQAKMREMIYGARKLIQEEQQKREDAQSKLADLEVQIRNNKQKV